MLFKFFALLPRMYRKSVLVQGFIAVVDLSTLWRYYAKATDKNHAPEAKRALATLLYTLWCRSLDVPLPDDVYFRDASPIITKLTTLSPKSGLQALMAFLKLIPKRFHAITQAHYDQLVAARNMKLMKERDRKHNRDEQPDQTNPLPKRKLENGSTDTVVQEAKKPAVTNPYAKKAAPKQMAPLAQNPYARKPLRPQAVSNDKKPSSATKAQSSATAFIESIRQQSAYKKKAPSSFPTPSLPCPVCNATICREPFLAPCGHVACWKCWQSWLSRSSTCVTCRQPTEQSALARAVRESHI